MITSCKGCYLDNNSPAKYPCINCRDYNLYENKFEMFYNSVACLIAEGSEFHTKSELYDSIKSELEKV